MSTKHTANIFIRNDSGGNAAIQMTHQYSDHTPESGSWQAAPGETVGPLVVHFETGIGTGRDWWWVNIQVKDGPHPGNYSTHRSHECMLEKHDAGKNIVNTVDTKTFAMNLASGGCKQSMVRRSQYSPITNVFVLMLENHSFDHLLGFSDIEATDFSTGQRRKVEGLTGNETNSYTDKNGKTTTYQVKKGAVDPMTTDPGHEFLDTLEQLCGQGTKNPFPKGPYPTETHSGFAADYATTITEGPTPSPTHVGDIMACCDSAKQVPALYALASHYAVFDHWYSSMPGPTWPNRFFAMGASSSGLDDSPSTKKIAEWEVPGFGFEYPHGSIFDLLRAHKLDYKLYNDFDDQFAQHSESYGGQIPIVSSLKNITMLDIHSFRHFGKDLQAPYPYELTWVEPNYGDIISNNYRGGSSQHPMDSLAAGDAMIASTYNAIRNSPLWPTSLLIITYDEHGGFYDHLNLSSEQTAAPAPGDHPKNKLNKHGYDFKNLGVRVPAVVISPQIEHNLLSQQIHEHSSIPKTIESLFGLPALTQRDAWAKSLTALISGPPREDCMGTIAVQMPPMLEELKPLSRADQAMVDMLPLPEKGNVIGFIYIAAKTDLELSDGSEASKQIIAAKVRSLKTKGDARRYVESVMAKVALARKALNVE